MKSFLEFVELLVPRRLRLLSSSRLALFSDLGLSLCVALCLGIFLELSSLFVEGIETFHESAVLKRILLQLVVEEHVLLDSADDILDLVRVYDPGEIGAGHFVAVELVTVLGDSLLSVGAEDIVESCESFLGPDDESAQMATWSELEEVETADVANLDAEKVPGCLLELRVLVTVDEQRALPHDVARVSHLALSLTDFP